MLCYACVYESNHSSLKYNPPYTRHKTGTTNHKIMSIFTRNKPEGGNIGSTYSTKQLFNPVPLLDPIENTHTIAKSCTKNNCIVAINHVQIIIKYY